MAEFQPRWIAQENFENAPQYGTDSTDSLGSERESVSTVSAIPVPISEKILLDAPVEPDPRALTAEQAEVPGRNPGATPGGIRPLEILEHVESTMNIRLVREGDKLRMRTRPETNIPAARERVRKLRDILFEEVLQREYVELVCCPPEQFDRARADAVFAEWHARYGPFPAQKQE